MRIEHLGRDSDVPALLKAIGVDGGGRKILADKASLHLILIRDLHVGAANILKQDALSVGADLAVPKGTIVAATETVDALLIASRRQLQALARKELAQPFGLKEAAKAFGAFAGMHYPERVKIMGVLNANDDSFFDGSRFKGADALKRIVSMAEEGAEIVDIGGVSSRPGSDPVPAQEELARVRPVIDALHAEKLYETIRFSIDSYAPEVIAYALDRGFTIVNDITGLADDEVCRLCARYDATAVIMHMRGTPKTMQDAPRYDALLPEVYGFFETRSEKAKRFGIEKVVLDVGIGFGKTLRHNLRLVNDLEHFLPLGFPLLVGASRKSMIDKIAPSEVSERLPGTLAIHLEAVRNGAAWLRVHDVKEHVQALKVFEALHKGETDGY